MVGLAVDVAFAIIDPSPAGEIKTAVRVGKWIGGLFKGGRAAKNLAKGGKAAKNAAKAAGAASKASKAGKAAKNASKGAKAGGKAGKAGGSGGSGGGKSGRGSGKGGGGTGGDAPGGSGNKGSSPGDFDKWLNKGPKDVTPYWGMKGGKRDYVGISNNLTRRFFEHKRKGGFTRLKAITGTSLTRNQARAIEQLKLEEARKQGVNLSNKINSISPNSKYHDRAIDWAKKYLNE